MKKSNKNLVHLIMAALLMALASCIPSTVEIPAIGNNDPTPTPTTEENILADTAWRLTSYGPSEMPTQAIEDTEVTLEFDGQGEASGSAGCNTFGADYHLVTEYDISITNIFATEMACIQEGVMEQEVQYLDALQTADLFEYTGDTLKIWYEDGHNVLYFSRMTR